MLVLKNILPLLACMIFLTLYSPAIAEQPDLEDGVFLKEGGEHLNVGGYPVPTVVDWDNDGDNDLLIGQYSNGRIILYLNQGSNRKPRLAGGVPIESGGSPIETSYG